MKLAGSVAFSSQH